MQLVLRLLLVISLVHQSASGPKARLKVKRVKLLVDPAVRSRPSSLSPTIANMSLSPWRYTDSCEESRLPRWISQAECLTSGCLSLQGPEEDAALMARPIHYEVLVLHRVPAKKGGRKRKKRYDFRLETEVITVGCTCVRPSIIA